MARKAKIHPTDAELAILQVLWNNGPCTVREVHEELRHSSKIGYTTVLKTLQIMTEKRLVRRDESARAHVYAARASQERTQSRLLADLLERAYRGAAGKMVLQALSSKRATREELKAIRALLDRLSEEDTHDGDH